MTELERAVMEYVNEHPQAAIMDVEAEFDLSYDEAMATLRSINRQIKAAYAAGPKDEQD